MDLTTISQIVLFEKLSVSAAPTAPRLFETLARRGRFAPQPGNALASAHLIANLEALCLHALQAHINDEEEIVLGANMVMKHHLPVHAGDQVQVTGFVVRADALEISFAIQACLGGRLAASGQLVFGVVRKELLCGRVADQTPNRAARQTRIPPADRVLPVRGMAMLCMLAPR